LAAGTAAGLASAGRPAHILEYRYGMSALGLLMFACAMALMIATGLPVYAVLLGVASLFAALGVALGAFDWALMGALPARLVGLLEHDLLQALPLYAFIGALLNHLPLAELLHRGGERLFARSGGAAELSALGVGALLAPMNGSVGASLHTLSRSIAPALAARRAPPAHAVATVCVASTLGIVIPPSLVLLLLGDAMMRAHTEAVNVTHAMVRIVNTQDVMRAALVPGALVLLTALLLVAWRTRATPLRALEAMPRRQTLTAAGAALVIAALLAGVAAGRLYAVEAAAAGGLLLLLYAALTGQIDRALMRHVLHDTMTLTGLLFALLVAATTFSLVLRAYATDVLIAQALQPLAGHPVLLLLCVLGGLVACSFVLDAFEMIFLVIPLVMPPLLMAVPDAAWVAALTLLVLQAGFLLPPFGYAIVMSRALMPGAPGLRVLSRALLPQLLAQGLLIAAVVVWPQITQWARPAQDVAAAPAVNADDADRLLREAVEAQQRGR
jgi:TRAP-type mannitol/chloroaromatic compound transport system permease large subunit